MFDFDFGGLVSGLGDRLASVAGALGSSPLFGGGFDARSPFGGQGFSASSPFQNQGFQAQSPFQGQGWQVGSPFQGQDFSAQSPFAGQGFQTQSPFAGSNPFAGLPDPRLSSQPPASAAPATTAPNTTGGANPSLGTLSGQQINDWIARTRPNSPLAGKGDYIAQQAQQAGVPVAVVLGIMMQESQLGADGSYLPTQNNFTGLTGSGWQGQTGTTSGMARAFATFGTPEDGIRAAIQNLAQGYKGLTIRQAVAKWLTGDPNGAGDEQGNSTAAYLSTMQSVFQGLGVSWNPDAPLSAPQQAPAASGAGAGLMAVTNGQGSIMQGFGSTDYSRAHPETYAFGSVYGLDGSSHTGIDIGVPRGTALYSPVAGTVSFSGGTGYYQDTPSGNAPGTGELMITLDDGTQVILGHTSRILPAVGTRVAAGQLVALSGESDGAHVHVEVRVPDRSMPGGYRIVDPNQYFGGGR